MGQNRYRLSSLFPRQLHLQVGFIVSLLLMAAMTVYAWHTAQQQSRDAATAIRRQASVMAESVASLGIQYLLVEDYASLEALLKRIGEFPNVLSLTVSDAKGKVLSRVVSIGDDRVAADYDAGQIETPRDLATAPLVLDDRIVIWHPIIEGKVYGWVRVDYSLQTLEDLKRGIWRDTLRAGVLVVAASIALILFLLRRYLRAIQRITVFAKNLNERRGESLRINGTAQEIEELAAALSETSRKLRDQDQSLRESSEDLERLRSRNLLILQSVGEGILGLDLEGRHIFANPAAVQLLGYDVAELIGRSCSTTWFRNKADGAPHDGGECPIADLFENDAGHHADSDIFWRKDGTGFPVEYTTTPIREGDRITGAVITFRDITTRKIAEDALRESEKKYRALFEESKDVILIGTLDGRILDVNHAGVELSGYASKEELLKANIVRDLYLNPGDQHVFRQAMERQGFIRDFETRLRRKDGEVLTVLVTATAVVDEKGPADAFRGILRDVTAERQLEQQLRHAQKMEAVGQLTGGIAHDFNNILTAIIGFGHLVLMKQKEDDPLRHFVEHILSAAERATHLTQSLLTFSRKQISNPKALDLNGIVQRVQKLLAKLAGEQVEISLFLSEAPLVVMADSGQVEQVLMNLAANARDAMPSGGRLVLESRRIELDSSFVQTHGYGKPGSYALLSLSDTGTGMDAQTAKRIFEPFYTTKEVGKGTGLGLSIVYGIMKQHNGYINVYSEPGHGTTFKIYFPLTAAAALEQKTQELVPYRGGSETLLLAEDDPEVRRLTKAVLTEFGYQIIEATDGDEAVRLFEERKDSIDMLILDVIMPKRNGREVYDAVRTLKPGVKVLFMSGYTANIITQRGILEEGMQFLPKPAAPTELLKRVREILDGS